MAQFAPFAFRAAAAGCQISVHRFDPGLEAAVRPIGRDDERAVVRDANKNLDAEAVRVAAECETALAEVPAAEQSHEIEIHRLAGQVVLSGEAEEARTKRQALEADLALKRDHLAVVRDAIPEIERRRVEEEEPREATTATCPRCSTVIALESLVVAEDVWTVA